MNSDLRGIISRRKKVDLIFGITGAALIALSLAVLVVLMASLVKDGAGPLFQTTEARADGSSFGRLEVLGTVEQQDGRWLLKLDPFTLTGVSRVTDKLQPLEGQTVAVSGYYPRPPQTTFAVDTVAAAPADITASDADLIGKLQRSGGDWTVTAPPLKMELADSVDASKLVSGKRYGVTGKRHVAKGTITAKTVGTITKNNFFNSFPSRFPEEAGILSAWVGTLLLMIVTMLTAVPVGVAAGIYLEEYAPKNKFTDLIEINIANLAGVPSIIWGLMALGLFIYQVENVENWIGMADNGITGLGRSVRTAGLTLGLLVLPIVIIATREAIRSIPGTIREASIGLGATKWQTVRHHVLPYSMSGILTGSIIALGRAIGETAPLITIGALTYIAFLPPTPVQAEAPFVNFLWLKSEFTVLPIQLFNWVSRPDPKFHHNAAAAGIVLVLLTLSLNAVAIYMRYRLRKGIKW